MATSESTYPRVAVGAVVLRGRRVLLVRRGKPPALGLWAVPGGAVGAGETLAQAAEREVFEETGILVRAGAVVHTFESIVRDEGGTLRYHYVVVDLAAEYVKGEPRAGDDAADARWVDLSKLDELDVSSETRALVLRLASADG